MPNSKQSDLLLLTFFKLEKVFAIKGKENILKWDEMINKYFGP